MTTIGLARLTVLSLATGRRGEEQLVLRFDGASTIVLCNPLAVPGDSKTLFRPEVPMRRVLTFLSRLFRRSDSSRQQSFVEPLENRLLLSTVAWDGDGGDFDWLNALNWSTDALPGAADDVVIDVPGDITVTLGSGGVAVRSINSEESLVLSGSRFVVSAESVVNGSLTLGSATALEVNGADASFTANGPATIDDAELFAVDGGRISLPTVTTYQTGNSQRFIRADGAGSVVSLPSLQSIVGPPASFFFSNVRIHAFHGGTVDLPSLTAVGQINTHTWIHLRGPESSINLPNAQQMYTVTILVDQGAHLHLPAVTRIETGDALREISVTGTDSRISMPSLMELVGSTNTRGALLEVVAQQGGVIETNQIQTIGAVGRQLRIKLNGAGSQLLAESAQAMVFTALIVENGAEVSFPALTLFESGNNIGGSLVDGSGSSIHMPALDALIPSLDRTHVTVSNGAVLDLPNVQTAGTFDVSFDFFLSGAGSQIRADSLATLDSVLLDVTDGAVLALPSLTDYRTGAFGVSQRWIIAGGVGSRIELPALARLEGARYPFQNLLIRSIDGGTIDLGNTTTLGVSGTNLAISQVDPDSTLNLASLKILYSTQVTARNGAVVSMPLLEEYHDGRDKARQFLADGAGSRIDMPALTTLTGSTFRFNTFWLEVRNGGVIDAHNLTTFGALNTLSGVIVRDPQSHVLLDSVTTMLGARISVSGGGVASFPMLTDYQTGSFETRIVRATGAGSRVEMPLLESFEGGLNNAIAIIEGIDGGAVQFGSSTTLSSRVQIATHTGVLEAGHLELVAGASVLARGNIDADVTNSAMLEIGSSSSVTDGLNIDGDLEQTHAGVLTLRVGGAVPVTQHDQLAITGHAALCGTLQTATAHGYFPGQGESFDAISYATVSGDFAVHASATFNGLRFADAKTPTALRLTAVPDELPTVTALTASPDPVPQGQVLTLTADGAVDGNGAISRVAFYRDTDLNGVLDACVDELLVIDSDGSDGWSAEVDTEGFPLGENRAFARAWDDDELRSNVVSATFTVEMSANEPPVAVDDEFATDEDVLLSASVLGNDSDPDGDELTAELLTVPAVGTLSFASDGTFTYTPAPNAHGDVVFTYRVSDGELVSAAATAVIHVLPVNDAPTGVGDSFVTDEDVPVSGSVLANDSDVDGDVLTAVLIGGPAVGDLQFSSDGQFTYTPASDFNGQVMFTYRATDGLAESADVTVTIDVRPVNDAPIALNDEAQTLEDQAVLIHVLDNDHDIDGDSLAVLGATTPGHGSVTLNSDGTITYTPDFDFSGLDGFSYTISDGQGGTASADVTVQVLNLVDLSGHVFEDAENNGLFDPGDAGIAGVAVRLVGTDANGTVDLTTATDQEGQFRFENLLPGEYSLIEVQQPEGLLDGDESAGSLGGTVDNTVDSNQIDAIVVETADPDASGYLFAEIRSSEMFGLVWEDFNDDGEVNFGERAIAGVTIEMTGTDDRGRAVAQSAATDADGAYAFVDLRPGTYALREVQPAGFDDGKDILGTINGVVTGDAAVNDQFSGLVLPAPGSTAQNYLFGERTAAGGEVTPGQTATIGFWQNKNGQALIRALNGGADATQLGDWLAATFPNMYGATAGDHDLTGLSNGHVAEFYRSLFRQNKKHAALGGPAKVDAQVMAVALATYVTNEGLAGTTAASYGFLVSEYGVGLSTFNIGDAGEAFGVDDGSNVAVLDILRATNDRTTLGVLYDLDGDGDADDSLESLMRQLANDVYSAINEAGDI